MSLVQASVVNAVGQTYSVAVNVGGRTYEIAPNVSGASALAAQPSGTIVELELDGTNQVLSVRILEGPHYPLGLTQP